jgi:aspartate racemase
MNREVRRRLGGFHSCRVILDSLDFDAFARASSRSEFEALRAELVASAERLEGAGCESILIACNTVHRFAQSVIDATSVPFLHIADALGEALIRDGHRKVGLLGTRATMEGAFYRKRLSAKFGVEVLVPERSSREALNRLILDELQMGSEPEACVPHMDQLIEDLAEQGATAVALACTELGLVYGSLEVPVIHRALPAYDTAIVHALAAVERMIS